MCSSLCVLPLHTAVIDPTSREAEIHVDGELEVSVVDRGADGLVNMMVLMNLSFAGLPCLIAFGGTPPLLPSHSPVFPLPESLCGNHLRQYHHGNVLSSRCKPGRETSRVA